MKPLEERKHEFKQLIWDKIGRNFDVYSKEMVCEFFEYWSGTKDNGRKMFFEMEKRWSTLGRLATWKRNAKKFSPKKVTQNNEKMPDYYSKAFMAKLSGNDQMKYKKHLESKGFKWNYSPTAGTHILTPEKERIWL